MTEDEKTARVVATRFGGLDAMEATLNAELADASPFTVDEIMALVKGHTSYSFAVGDLVTLANWKDVTWRVSSRHPDPAVDEFVCLPLPHDIGDMRPRVGQPSKMNLVKAWDGLALVRCNADASDVVLA